MAALFPYASKGLILIGSLSILTGTIYTFLDSNTTDDTLNYGELTEMLAPSIRKVNIACSFFPRTSAVLDRLHRHVNKFVTLYHSISLENQHKTTQKLTRAQRKIFTDIDDLILEQSETIAIEELFEATDDLKQQVTNICLSVDR